ncbi:MAG: hypothetical protein IJT50_05030 [Lentisphaeria bacterium]|nr:hypothetical protein [Lentisphaeria bacterium]
MIKFMCAPVIVFSLLLADILLLKRKRILLALPAFLVFLPLIWCFPAGQQLSNLGPFLLYSWHIATGYGYAMACSIESPWWIVLLGAGSAAVLFIILLADRKGGACRPVLDRICRILLTASVLFVVFKYGCVRMDLSHIMAAVYFLSTITVFCSVDPGMETKWRCALSILSIVLVGVPMAVMASFPSSYLTFASVVFLAAVAMYVLKKYAVLDRGFRFLLIFLLAVFILLTTCSFFWPRAALSAAFFSRLPENDVQSADAAVRKTPAVDCFSHEILPVLRSGMRYSPRLVFQSYSAYTPLLLRKNAEHFGYDAGPEYIFYGDQELDGILPAAFDSLSLLHIMNNYEPISGRKLLRKKTHRPLPVRLTKIRTVRSKFERKIELPQRAENIWLSIDFRDSFAGFLLKNAVRPTAVMIHLELEDKRIVAHKIIPENCTVPFLVSPYLPGWAQADLLLDAKGKRLPRVVSFSVYPVVYLGNGHWDHKVGKNFFKRHFSVHFYRADPSPEKTKTERSRG